MITQRNGPLIGMIYFAEEPLSCAPAPARRARQLSTGIGRGTLTGAPDAGHDRSLRVERLLATATYVREARSQAHAMGRLREPVCERVDDRQARKISFDSDRKRAARAGSGGTLE